MKIPRFRCNFYAKDAVKTEREPFKHSYIAAVCDCAYCLFKGCFILEWYRFLARVFTESENALRQYQIRFFCIHYLKSIPLNFIQ